MQVSLQMISMLYKDVLSLILNLEFNSSIRRAGRDKKKKKSLCQIYVSLNDTIPTVWVQIILQLFFYAVN